MLQGQIRERERERERNRNAVGFIWNYQRPTKLLSFFFIMMTSPILVINYAQMSKIQMMECLIISFEYQSSIHNRKLVVTRLHSWDKWKLCAHRHIFQILDEEINSKQNENIPIIVRYIFYTYIYFQSFVVVLIQGWESINWGEKKSYQHASRFNHIFIRPVFFFFIKFEKDKKIKNSKNDFHSSITSTTRNGTQQTEEKSEVGFQN